MVPYDIGPEHLTFIATFLAAEWGYSRVSGTRAPSHVKTDQQGLSSCLRRHDEVAVREPPRAGMYLSPLFLAGFRHVVSASCHVTNGRYPIT